jgi:uncharacterized protein (UPF0332 family)
MNPRDFHALAVELLTKSTPSRNRSAISRAYYAAFHVALDHLQAAGFTIARNDSVHREVSRLLDWSDDATLKNVGAKLNDLRGARNRADYDVAQTKYETDKTAAAWVQAAADCIATLDQTFGGPNIATIVDTIRINRKRVYGS